MGDVPYHLDMKSRKSIGTQILGMLNGIQPGESLDVCVSRFLPLSSEDVSVYLLRHQVEADVTLIINPGQDTTIHINYLGKTQLDFPY